MDQDTILPDITTLVRKATTSRLLRIKAYYTTIGTKKKDGTKKIKSS
jgi:hypothetical protein